MEKNLTWLNSKWWYRLLKVLYILTFIAISCFYIALSFSELKPERVVDYDESTLICTKNSKTFTFSELSSTLRRDLQRSNVVAEDIAYQCDYVDAYGEKLALLEKYKIKSREELQRDLNNAELISQWKSDTLKSYSLNTVMKTEGNWFFPVLASIASVVIIFLLLELFKRIFYYVLLGTVRPKR